MRNLKIWFTLRKGLLREMFGGKPQTVRAVDGVSFDVRRGEVFCLVGESGCGKTSTGKALLGLVQATEGDIFLEAPDAEYAGYEDARRRGTEDPEASSRVEEFRRKYSLTWKETVPWTVPQILLFAGFLTAGFFAALLPALVVGYLTTPYSSSGVTIGAALVGGAILGFIGTLPPTRPNRRTPAILALLGIAAVNLAPIVAFSVSGAAADAPAMFGNAWGGDTFGLLVASIFGPATAGGVGRAILASRRQREGLMGVRMRNLRRRLQLIFQDPYESLNPKQSVYEIVSEPLRVNRIVRSPDEASERVERALEEAGLRPPKEFMFRFPHELSGGQRQRVSVAAALVLEPEFIVADEPVSMLDVSIRTQILQLMMEMRQARRITYLFITHDLSLAWVLADRIAVMYLGQIVEQGTAEQVIGEPKHPYTRALISVVPSPDPRHFSKRMILKGERPDPVDIPTGCRFHPRCPVAFEKCGWNAQEVSEEFAEAELEIAARLEGSIDERRSRIEELRKPGPEEGGATGDRDAKIRQLEKEIQDLEGGRQRAEQLAGAFRPGSANTVVVNVPPGQDSGQLEEAFRGLVEAQKDHRLAFRAITGISAAGGTMTIALHEWSEPEFVEVSPGNSVACHLINAPGPGTTAPAIVTA